MKLRAATRVLAVLGMIASAVAWAGAKQLTVVFTGDNGGEIAPCG